jgi:Icc protein
MNMPARMPMTTMKIIDAGTRVRSRGVAALAAVALSAGLTGCLRLGEERALSDLEVGVAAGDAVTVAVDDGLAHVREVVAGDADTPGRITLWGSAPAFSLALGADVDRTWELTVLNCMPDAQLTAQVAGEVTADVVDLPGPRPTVRRWQVTLRGRPGAAEARLRVAPPDAGTLAPGESWRFAVMGDIQRALGQVDDVFERINEDPSIRFVASTGDLVQSGDIAEYTLLERQLEVLDVPYFSTIGNHELFGDHERWRVRFGRFNLHFRFKGAVFSLVDSGNSSVDPLVYEWLDAWLDAARDEVHLFFTHYPAVDPVGVRAGSLRSAAEAQKLLGRLAEGRVDVTFYGHIHSYYAFANAGIPAFISGGGGAIPERWDGIGRHFLTVDIAAGSVQTVGVVRVD